VARAANFRPIVICVITDWLDLGHAVHGRALHQLNGTTRLPEENGTTVNKHQLSLGSALAVVLRVGQPIVLGVKLTFGTLSERERRRFWVNAANRQANHVDTSATAQATSSPRQGTSLRHATKAPVAFSTCSWICRAGTEEGRDGGNKAKLVQAPHGRQRGAVHPSQPWTSHVAAAPAVSKTGPPHEPDRSGRPAHLR
jgi:hypothetical protein